MFIAALLVFQAAWIALSAQYPLAFDENFHFGIIKLHALQLSPFFTHTPDGSGIFGALVRDPSYLYHYLMSFPYRIITLFTHDEVHQIIALRFLNIAFFTAGLVAFWQLLNKLGISKQLTNISLLMLIFVPVVPFLAAHINYDNLLFLCVPLTLSLALTCGRILQKTGEVPLKPFLTLIIMSLLTTLVKYVFLPILVAIAIYLFVIFWRKSEKKLVLRSFAKSFSDLRPIIQAGFIIALLLAGGLFVERDVMNAVKYHAITPPCAKVESVEHCLQFGPWARDYHYAQRIKNGDRPTPDPNPVFYGVNWIHDLLYRLFFAINYNYATKPPLLIPYRVAAVVGFIGTLLFCFWSRRILSKNRHLLLPLAVILIYGAALFYENYSAYLRYGERVAVNGRYFIPLLPFIFTFIGLGYLRLFAWLQRPWRQISSAVLVSALGLIILQGGGILTFMTESEPNWYWQDQTVIQVNQAAQNLVVPFIVGLY